MKRRKIVGVGNTATVYELGKNRVIKLFHESYPKESVEKEFKNARLIWNMDFSKPKAYEIIYFKNQIGIVYEKVKGESLLHWVMRTRDLKKCAKYMARLHKKIINHRVNHIQDYKKFLKVNINKVENLKEKKEVLYILDRLPDGNNLCHGDYHPGNIFIYDGQTTVIDFMNICRGHYLYDIARTVFLLEYTPVAVETKDEEKFLQFRKTLADLYMVEMNVNRELIQDYLKVITVARIGECSVDKTY